MKKPQRRPPSRNENKPNTGRSKRAQTGLTMQQTTQLSGVSAWMKVNEGEVPQYNVEHSHEAILSPEKWEKVQLVFADERLVFYFKTGSEKTLQMKNYLGTKGLRPAEIHLLT